MNIVENATYRLKNGEGYVHVKEVTRYNDEGDNIAQIVTGGVSFYPSDAATNIIRKVYTLKEFVTKFKMIGEL